MGSGLQLDVNSKVVPYKIFLKISFKSTNSSCFVENLVHLSSLLQGKHKSDCVMIEVLTETNL